MYALFTTKLGSWEHFSLESTYIAHSSIPTLPYSHWEIKSRQNSIKSQKSSIQGEKVCQFYLFIILIIIFNIDYYLIFMVSHFSVAAKIKPDILHARILRKWPCKISGFILTVSF